MSIVYVVVDSVTGKRFALKGLARETVELRREVESRFEREATAWVNLDYHPHIVQAFAYLKRPDRPFLLLEYVDGPSLTEVLMSVGKLVPRQAIRWARQFCSGMEYAHKRRFAEGQIGLIHRDIKPSNIMITRQCVLKITDFGLAKLNDDRRISDTVLLNVVCRSRQRAVFRSFPNWIGLSKKPTQGAR